MLREDSEQGHRKVFVLYLEGVPGPVWVNESSATELRPPAWEKDSCLVFLISCFGSKWDILHMQFYGKVLSRPHPPFLLIFALWVQGHQTSWCFYTVFCCRIPAPNRISVLHGCLLCLSLTCLLKRKSSSLLFGIMSHVVIFYQVNVSVSFRINSVLLEAGWVRVQLGDLFKLQHILDDLRVKTIFVITLR